MRAPEAAPSRAPPMVLATNRASGSPMALLKTMLAALAAEPLNIFRIPESPSFFLSVAVSLPP